MNQESRVRLLLVRHGATAWNEDGRVQGQLDIPLSELGRVQAQALTHALQQIPLQAAFTSDLARCRETAALCLSGLGVTAAMDPRLRERHYGVWQGIHRQDIGALTGAGPADQAPGIIDEAPEGGESWAGLRRRVAAAIDNILATNAGRTVLVVGHGGTLRAAFCHLMALPGRARGSLRTGNCCICEFEVRAGAACLVRWNDTHQI